jgi:hypothetical protein
MRIMVDGVERCRFNPAEQSSISFSAEEDAEVIEVKTLDQHGDLLLATHLLDCFGKDAHRASIRLEGGQELSLSITRRQREANGETDLLVKFGYRETNLRRAARLWWERHGLRLSSEPEARSLWAISARYVLAGSVVLVICLTSYLAYVRLTSHETIEPVHTSSVQATPVVPVHANASQPPRQPKTNRSIATKTPSLPRAEPAAPIADEDIDAAVRSSNAIAGVKLSEVKKVYVDIRGEAASNELRSSLVESLNSSGVITVATNADEADAALKIVVSQTGTSARLVNARGTVLWSKSYTNPDKIVNDLLSEIRHTH